MTSDETSVSEQNWPNTFQISHNVKHGWAVRVNIEIFWPNKNFGFFRVLYVTDPFNLSRLVTYGK